MEEKEFLKAVSLQEDIKKLRSKINDMNFSSKTEGSELGFKGGHIELNVVYQKKKDGYSYSENVDSKKSIVIDSKLAKHLYFQYKNELMAQLTKLENQFSQL